MSEEEKAEEKAKGRPKGALGKKEYAIIHWRYTRNQTVEDYDVENDKVIEREVEDFEKKTYKERVPLDTVKQDNCFMWESNRNDKLARAGKRNRIRVINWYPERETEEDAIDGEKDGTKIAVLNAGASNG